MGDLDADTAVHRLGEGRYSGQLSAEWEIWGPMGGYVASLALRAVGAESRFARPASFFCHFLGVAAFERVDIAVTTVRDARTASAHRVALTQGPKPILDAMVWSIGEVEGLEHHLIDPPLVPGPEELASMEELMPDGPPYPFWNNLESKPVDFEPVWPPPGPRPPVWRNWSRFRPTATFSDPWVDAVRSIILIDVQSWPSGARPHMWAEPPFIAPSLDLFVAFHEPAQDHEWLLADGFSPVATDGLMGWTGKLWSGDRRLVASGGGQGLFRRLAQPGP